MNLATVTYIRKLEAYFEKLFTEHEAKFSTHLTLIQNTQNLQSEFTYESILYFRVIRFYQITNLIFNSLVRRPRRAATAIYLSIYVTVVAYCLHSHQHHTLDYFNFDVGSRRL